MAGHVVTGPWSQFLTEIAGQPVSLIRTQEPGSGCDQRAVTLMSAESVVELGRAAMQRDHAHPDTGARDLKTLQLISQGRGMTPNDFGEDLKMGVYADVVKPAVISSGDELLLGESPTS